MSPKHDHQVTTKTSSIGIGKYRNDPNGANGDRPTATPLTCHNGAIVMIVFTQTFGSSPK